MATVAATSVCCAPVAALGATAENSSKKSAARAQLGAPALKSRTLAKPLEWKSKTVANGSRVNAFNVVNPEKNLRYETLSFLPPLSDEEILKQVEYILRNGWIPAIEFDKSAELTRIGSKLPTYYEGRYWVMWKLPLFGAKDPSPVLGEIQNCKAEYPGSFIRVIAFDNVRQVQVVSFIVYKPKGY